MLPIPYTGIILSEALWAVVWETLPVLEEDALALEAVAPLLDASVHPSALQI